MASPSSAVGREVSSADQLIDGQLVVRIDGSCVYPRMLVGGMAHGPSKMPAAGLPSPPAFTATC